MINSSPQFQAWVESARAKPIEPEVRRAGLTVEKDGHQLAGPRCPICSDSGDDRFWVDIRKNTWGCRHCGKRAEDVIALVMAVSGCNFIEACEKLTGEPPPEDRPNGRGNSKSRASAGRPIAVEEYDYEDEHGNLHYQVLRVEYEGPDGQWVLKDGKRKKTFWQRRPDPAHAGRWINDLNGCMSHPYKLPELLESLKARRPVLLVEGERKVNVLRSMGFAATCNSGGAQKWTAEHSKWFAGARAIILPDADEAGRKHRDVVAASLKEAGAEVKILQLPGLTAKQDVVDWVEAGGTREQLIALARDARPWAYPNGYDDAPTSAAEKELPTIRLRAGFVEQIVNQTEAAVIAADRGLFQRGGLIVRIGEIKLLGADEKETTSLAILEQSDHTLFEDITASAIYEKYDMRSEAWVRTNPPMWLVKAWQGRGTRLRLPILSGVILTPLLLRTGRVIERPGYDPQTGFFFDPSGTVFPPIPKKPTREDAVAALKLLKNLIAEFPFIDEPSTSVALSGLLTTVSRRALDFAPMHAATAPDIGTGKSYLIDLFCTLATGRNAPVVAQGRTEEEFEKRLDAHLLKGVGFIAIDNIQRPLEGTERLCQILTQKFVEIRPLGTSDKVTIQPDAFITANGNNLTIVEDLRRRALLSSMDAELERPELRVFKRDPVEIVKADRGKYVVAALTIILAHMAAKPKRTPRPINGYEQWCSMVRDPLLWLGCADPCETMETIRKQDRKLEVKKQIAQHWINIFGDQEKTAREVVDEAERSTNVNLLHPEFYAALAEIAKDGKTLSSVRLGHWLKKVQGQIIPALEDPDNPKGEKLINQRFERADDPDRSGAAIWALKAKPLKNQESLAEDADVADVVTTPREQLSKVNSTDQLDGMTTKLEWTEITSATSATSALELNNKASKDKDDDGLDPDEVRI